MAQPERPLSPFLHYRWQYTNTLSNLHRITGVLLCGCFLLLVYWLAAAATGPETYEGAMRCFGSPLTQVVLFGGLASLCFHLLAGVRHLFFDLGHGFELPTARRSGWAVAIGAVVLALATWVILSSRLGGIA
jgi:succinate dehydrogenase / fumarate reductase cytochrome b subunit